MDRLLEHPLHEDHRSCNMLSILMLLLLSSIIPASAWAGEKIGAHLQYLIPSERDNGTVL